MVYNGSRTTSSTSASNSGVSLMLHSHALLATLSPRTFQIDSESGTLASQQTYLMLLFRAQSRRYQLNARVSAYLLTNIMQDKRIVASNIEAQARYASILFIWTDCDREGEHIGTEIRDIALKVNPNMQVYRARFSNIERAWVILFPVD